MAYDPAFVERLRALLAETPEVVERKMFGGVAFLVRGHMAVVASSQGGLMTRVDPAEWDHVLATTAARPAEMRGRPLRGWLRLDPEHVTTSAELAAWVTRATRHVAGLPATRRRRLVDRID